MKAIYTSSGTIFFKYNVVAETDKSFIAVYSEGNGEYEIIFRKADENIKWFNSEEDVKAYNDKLIEIQKAIEDFRKTLQTA